ncbi:MAG: hypothetical protein ACTHMM_11945 [Agriterribacter sp.]
MNQDEKFRQLKRFISNPVKKRWVFYGVFFGYPVCCIEAFCSKDTLVTVLTFAQKRTHRDTGFIPCPACARKILQGQATLESLITNRISSLPFPIDERPGDAQELKEAVEKQPKSDNKAIEL